MSLKNLRNFDGLDSLQFVKPRRFQNIPEKTIISPNPLSSRSAVLIDHSNVEAGASELGWKFSYRKLVRVTTSSNGTKIITCMPQEVGDYVDHRRVELTKLGIQVITKPFKVVNGRKVGDLDVEIACAAFSLVSRKIDKIYLVTGDSDFVPLVVLLKSNGISVAILSFPHNTSRLLKDVADEFIPVGKDLLQKPERR